ncbi:splicing factor 3B subunit 2-like [Rosa chinensis]|nr:splicing factor 3B subunit 2-like [Rosa chinensis]
MTTTETLWQHPNGALVNNDDPPQLFEQVEIEYVPEQLAELNDGMYADFKQIFEYFTFKDAAGVEEEKKDDVHHSQEDSNSEEDNQQKQEKGVSNKKKKRVKMNIAELKQMCARPDVVEVWDATAADPKLLVFLKSYRNTVQVPRHWSQKRKYLQGTRGVKKQPFQLPDYIAATGIEKLRQAYNEKEDNKKLKQKQRERMQPKMGKMDIDYQVLHDAFFKHQVKPKLTTVGDLYYEGKEFDQVTLMDQMKPGAMLSHELQEALGMSEGAPPPWLISMQRYGPPPSYPHLKIPGLNAPIPGGASFGYHPGGWGKPPVNEYGRPLYGNVFGVEQTNHEEEPVEKMKHWGELEEEEEEKEEIEKEKDLEDDMESVDSFSSGGADQTVPDVIELRKQQRKETAERPLYQVLEEKEERVAAGALLGTTHTYVVGSNSSRDDKAGAKRVDLLRCHKADKVDVTLQPEELEAMENVLPEKYQQAREEEKMRSQPEDFSDMVAENEKQRKRKMQEKEAKSNKKQKDFKF